MVQRIPLFDDRVTIVCHRSVVGGVGLVTPAVVQPCRVVNQIISRTLRVWKATLSRALPSVPSVVSKGGKRVPSMAPHHQRRNRLANNASQKLVCGGLAGVTSKTITAPVDRIRLLMMTSNDAAVHKMSGAFETAIAHPRGIRALWMGNGINCIKIAPEMALKLFAFDHLSKVISQDPSHSTTTERLVAGACAGALAECTVYPMDVLRTRMATGKYANLSSCARAVWSNGGARAFFAGLSMSIVGIIPYASIDLCVFSTLKDMAIARAKKQGQETQKASVPALLACGMVSSATSASLTFPLMVIRTKAQATSMGIGRVIRGIMVESGGRGFYRGLAPSLLTVMPATSISYTAYEWLNAQMSG